jgi:AcrR family transcriptional regulator
VKTKDRILKQALELFNAEGATLVSALDIANAMSISPGHLYYHFRGKAELIHALFLMFEEELGLVLEAALTDLSREDSDLQTLWTHVEIIVEETRDVRFLFRESGALALLLPALRPRYQAVLEKFAYACTGALNALRERGVVDMSDVALDAVAGAMATGLFYKLTQRDLQSDAPPPRQEVERAAAEIMLIVAPFAV